MLEKQPEMEVIAEAEDGRTTVQLARELSPHMVIMDVAMPGLNGIEATQQIVADNPAVKVVALSMHSDKQFVTGMLKAGARGYVLKESAFRELIQAISAVMADQTYMSPKVATMVLEGFLAQEVTTVYSILTKKELNVLKLLAQGNSSREIASILQSSVGTIEKHRSNIMKKLKIHSVVELTKFAIREGLTNT